MQSASAARTEPVTAVAERCVARRPILDVRGRVHGYELLLRDGGLDGLERYTNGLPGFVSCTADSLLGQPGQTPPAATTVLVIAAATEPTPELLKVCVALRAAGFQLALAGEPRNGRGLAERADYIVVDSSGLDDEARGRLRSFAATKIARNVATQEDFQQAAAAGCTLFEGDYFCQPGMAKNRKTTGNRFFHFELLRHLNREPIDLKKVAELVLRDAALTYRLLRLVNSPLCAIQREVTSIEAALIIIGEQAFRRMATLAILSELNDGQPQEILQMALVRARFCALAAEMCAQDAAEQYLLGLLSLLPAMLGLPMEALTPSLPLRAEVRDALEGAANAERALLTWFEVHERGDWTACDAIAAANCLSIKKLVHSYGEAVDWARATLHAAA